MSATLPFKPLWKVLGEVAGQKYNLIMNYKLWIMNYFTEYVEEHKFRDNLPFTRWFVRRWGDEFKDDRDSMNLKPSNILTLHSNNSHISISSLFHQKRMLYEGWFYVYIYNVQRSEDWNWEVRVHTCRWPCAHGRRSFFRHSAIGCAHEQQKVCTRTDENVPENGGNV